MANDSAYMPQKNEVPAETMQKMLARCTPTGMRENLEKIGIVLDENGNVPKSGGAPRIFMVKDGKVRTLEEEGVKFPSSEFLEADKHVHARAYGPFVDDLKKLKNEKGFDAELRENLTEFMEEHPMVHGAARDFIEQNGLKFSVPEPPEGVSGEIADKMKSVDDVLRKELKIPQKQQPQQQKEKTVAINDPKLENDATKPQAAAPGM